MENQKFVKIEGDIFWWSGDKVNDLSGKYQFDLCNLSPAAVKWLEANKVAVKKREDKPEMGFYVTYKSGKYPITAMDRSGDKIEALIGNGSRAQVVTGVYEWEFRGKKGASPSARKVIITNLIEYTDDVASVDGESLAEMESDVL